jgi:hypothetical protein
MAAQKLSRQSLTHCAKGKKYCDENARCKKTPSEFQVASVNHAAIFADFKPAVKFQERSMAACAESRKTFCRWQMRHPVEWNQFMEFNGKFPCAEGSSQIGIEGFAEGGLHAARATWIRGVRVM